MRVSMRSVFLCSVLGAGLLQGCSCSTTDNPTSAGPTSTSSSTGGGGAPPGGPLSTAMVAANDPMFSSPFDAALSADGSIVFFSAVGPMGPGVFSTPASGGAISTVAAGDPLGAPFRIALSTDGKHVYVADLSAEGTKTDGGKIFSVPAEGGAPAEVTGSDNAHARGLAVASENGKDVIYFAGTYNSMPGVFKLLAEGGEPTPVSMGAPLVDPEAVALDSTGKVYVIDPAGSDDHLATLYEASTAAATEFLAHIPINFPAGLAVSLDDKTVLVSGLDPTVGTASVWQIDVLSKEPTPFPNDKTFDGFFEPGGLHRAAMTEAFAFVIADAKGGSVYFLK